jgi:hypothetical protein
LGKQDEYVAFYYLLSRLLGRECAGRDNTKIARAVSSKFREEFLKHTRNFLGADFMKQIVLNAVEVALLVNARIRVVICYSIVGN